MKKLRLESLLDDRYPEASFHDALISRIELDYAKRTAVFRMRLVTDVVESEMVFVDGTLTFSGLLFFAAEPPRNERIAEWDTDALWLVSDGPLPDPEVQLELKLPAKLPDDCFLHYLYFSDIFSYAVIAAREARFAWDA